MYNTLFELKSPKKGLIKIKNNDQKCFLWCHVRHINPVKIHLEGIAQEDKKVANVFNYDRIGFPVREKDFSKIETKTIFALMCFVMEIGWLFQSAFQIKNIKIQWICCLYLIKTSHTMCISKILTDLCFTKQRIKTKKYFCKNWLQCRSNKNVLTEHKEVCWSINGAQSARLEKGTTDFKSYFK